MGEEALRLATESGHVDVVKYLMQHGAQANAKNSVRIDIYNITYKSRSTVYLISSHDVYALKQSGAVVSVSRYRAV